MALLSLVSHRSRLSLVVLFACLVQFLGTAGADQSEVPRVFSEDVSPLLRQRALFQRRDAVRQVGRTLLLFMVPSLPTPVTLCGLVVIGPLKLAGESLRATNGHSNDSRFLFLLLARHTLCRETLD